MGSLSEAYFCKRGHWFHTVLGDVFQENYDVGEDSGCLCGQEEYVIIAYASFPGDNDGDGIEIEKTGEEKVRYRIENAVDKAGNPIEAYQDIILSVYDVTRYFPE